MITTLALFILIGWLFFAALVGAAARSRGRSFLAWMLLAIVISPLAALIFLIAFRNRHGEPPSRAGAAVAVALIIGLGALAIWALSTPQG